MAFTIAVALMATGVALLLGRLPRTGGYRVVVGRKVRIMVLNDAGEDGREPPVTIEDGLQALRIAVAATRAREMGLPVQIASIAGGGRQSGVHSQSRPAAGR